MFCSKCGAEVANGERFCSACGAPAGAAAPRAPKVKTNFFATIGTNVKNLGVNSTLYVGYLLTLVLGWLFVNMPIFAIKSNGLFDFEGSSTSYGFTQLAGLFSRRAESMEEVGWVCVMTAIICVLINLALLAGIVLTLLPVLLGKKVAPALTLVGLITAASSYFLVVLNYIFVACGVGTKVTDGNGYYTYTSYAFGKDYCSWPSMAGWMYMLVAVLSILFAIALLTTKKNKN